jgi:hypothetical protein
VPQEPSDTTQLPGTTSTSCGPRKRIAELEAEFAIHRRAAELVG